MSRPISKKTVFAGRVIDVGVEEHALPNGRTASLEVVRHPGGAAVLPVLPDGRLLLIRQYRAAVGGMIYEIPAGRLEPGEPASVCAARELAEETGYIAKRLESLGGLWSTPGFCDEYIALFLARDLEPFQQGLEPDEVIELCPLSLAEALQGIASGAIRDGKTQVALLRYHEMQEANS